MRRKKKRIVVRRKEKRKYQKFLKKRLTKSVKLKCSVCKHPICKKYKGIWIIDTTNKDIYTEEVRKNWSCVLCKK